MTLLLAGAGVVGGATVIGIGYYVVKHDPASIARVVSTSAREAFAIADSYESRKFVYFSLPEPDVPLSMLEVVSTTENTVPTHCPSFLLLNPDPNPVLQNQILEAIGAVREDGTVPDRPQSSSSHDESGTAWGRQVNQAFNAAESNLLLTTKAELRGLLIEERAY